MKKLAWIIICSLSLVNAGYSQWQEASNGLYGGEITALTVDPLTNNVYAGAWYNGMFLSTDNGNNWSALNNGFFCGISAIATNGSNIYAGTNVCGVYLSTDNGNSWMAVNNGISGEGLYIKTLVISGSNIFAGTYGGGVYLSTDNGSNWTSISNGLSGEALIVNSISISGINIYAGTQDGVYLSTDNGTTWIAKNNGLSGFDRQISSIAISGSNIFAGSFGGGGVFLSSDNGDSWTSINNGLLGSCTSLSLNGNYLFAGTTRGVFLTTNSGASWTALNNGIPGIYITSIAANNNYVFAGTSGGVFSSGNNGENWTNVNNDLPFTSINSLAVKENYFFAGTGSGVFLSNDQGTSWSLSQNGLPVAYINSVAVNESYVFAGIPGNGIYRSPDNGNTWTWSNNGLWNYSVNSISTQDNIVYAGTYDGIFFSDDNGNTWTAKNNGLTSTAIRTMAINGSNIFAGTDAGVFRSINNGDSWAAINDGLESSGLLISCLAVCGNNIYAGTLSGGIYLSTDNGNHWTAINNRLPYSSVHSIVIVAGTVYIGTENGVYMSKNSGSTWVEANTGLLYSSITALTFDNTHILAGDNRNGIWKRLLTDFLHFIPIWSGNGMDHMNFYAMSAQIDGVDMQPGDEIGIFDGSICVGAGVLSAVLNGTNYFEIRVSRDDPETPAADGYTTGHQATFRLWDASEQREITDCDITYLIGDNTFDIGASCWYQIGGTAQVDQTVALNEGWNIFSLYVVPENVDMLTLIQPLIDEGSLVKIQDETGAAIEPLPMNLGWVNNIHDWRITEGYKIRVDRNTSLTVNGTPNVDPLDIPMTLGWNIIGYPFSSPQAAMTALQGLINANNLMKVQDETGAAIEPMPLNLGWINNIGDFESGEGYKVRVAESSTLTLNPPVAGGLKSTGTALGVPRYFKKTWEGNGYDHMNVYLSLSSADASLLKPGDEIAVYDGELCVGAAVFQHQNQNQHQNLLSIPVSNDDPSTAFIDGFTAGNTMSFKVWRAADNAEVTLETLQYLPGYSAVFEPLGTTVAGLSLEGTGMDTWTTSLGDNYPNPFSMETTIPYNIGETAPVDLTIYDVLGLRVTTLIKATLEPGSYEITWNGVNSKQERVRPGIYFYRMIAGENIMVKTIEVIE